jgi:hypothetical protein
MSLSTSIQQSGATAAAAFDAQPARADAHAAHAHATVFYKGKRIRQRPKAHQAKRARHPLSKHLKQKAAAQHGHRAGGAHLSRHGARHGAAAPRAPHLVNARHGGRGGQGRDDTPEQDTEQPAVYALRIRAKPPSHALAPLPGQLQAAAAAYANTPHLARRLLALYDDHTRAFARTVSGTGSTSAAASTSVASSASTSASVMLTVFGNGHDLLAARILGQLTDELEGNALPVARMPPAAAPLMPGAHPAASVRTSGTRPARVSAPANPQEPLADTWTTQCSFNVLRELVRFNLAGPRTLSQLRRAAQHLRMQHALAAALPRAHTSDTT